MGSTFVKNYETAVHISGHCKFSWIFIKSTAPTKTREINFFLGKGKSH